MPEFSKPAFAFVALGRARFVGPSGHRYHSDYRCQLRYEEGGASELEDVRVYLVGHESVGVDEDVAVLVAFLRWEDQAGRCVIGARFRLCEGATETATGIVESLAAR